MSTKHLTIIFLILSSAAVPLAAQNAPLAGGRGFGRSSLFAAINPLQLPPEPRFPESVQRTEIPDKPIRRGAPVLQPRSSYPGPAQIQSSGGPSLPTPRMPVKETPLYSWEGLPDSTFVPADPDMAVGPDDVLVVINTSIARYTRQGQQTSISSFKQWFNAFLPSICPFGTGNNCLLFDPVIRYDQFHGRFILVVASLDFNGSSTNWLISVSDTPNFAGGWKNWAINAGVNNGVPDATYLDQPKVGFDNEAVYLTGNFFNINTFIYVKLRILKKSELYGTQPATLTFFEQWDMKNQDNTLVSTLQPPHPHGRTMASFTGTYLVNSNDNTSYLTLWQVTNPTSANPTFTRTTVNGLWKYDKPARAPLFNTGITLDVGDSAVLKSIFRDGNLYTVQNNGYSDAPTTVTYTRVDTVNKKLIAQQRWINGNFFYGALDIPASLGPGAVSFPNVLPVGSNTENGTVTFIGFQGVKAGEAPYNEDRWGDYFGGAIDPGDGGLWTYGAFAKSTTQPNRWSTWAALFPLATSPQFDDVPSTHPFFDNINVLGLWKITVGCTATTFCPSDIVTRGQAAAFIIRSIAGENFTFSDTPAFTDVPANNPYFKYIQKMKELGLTLGCTATTFCPGDNVTRGQFAVFVIRAKMKTLFGETFPSPATAFFTDVPSDHIFFKFIQKLRELGITSGCSATAYCPNDNVTRGQAAKLLHRAFLN
ncbi:MAG: S-layer homology domain-containing protein [Bryobacteraceae bacterium]